MKIFSTIRYFIDSIIWVFTYKAVKLGQLETIVPEEMICFTEQVANQAKDDLKTLTDLYSDLVAGPEPDDELLFFHVLPWDTGLYTLMFVSKTDKIIFLEDFLTFNNLTFNVDKYEHTRYNDKSRTPPLSEYDFRQC